MAVSLLCITSVLSIIICTFLTSNHLLFRLEFYLYINRFFILCLFFPRSVVADHSLRFFWFFNLAYARCNFKKTASRVSPFRILITVTNSIAPHSPKSFQFLTPLVPATRKNWYLVTDVIHLLNPFITPRERDQPSQWSKCFHKEW